MIVPNKNGTDRILDQRLLNRRTQTGALIIELKRAIGVVAAPLETRVGFDSAVRIHYSAAKKAHT